MRPHYCILPPCPQAWTSLGAGRAGAGPGARPWGSVASSSQAEREGRHVEIAQECCWKSICSGRLFFFFFFNFVMKIWAKIDSEVRLFTDLFLVSKNNFTTFWTTSYLYPTFVLLISEFQPGVPWKGIQNIDPESDPYVTPGSVLGGTATSPIVDTDHQLLRDNTTGK